MLVMTTRTLKTGAKNITTVISIKMFEISPHFIQIKV
jgi:hypothetical protein